MFKERIVGLVVAGGTLLATSAFGQPVSLPASAASVASDFEATCSTLNRPRVDCACVGRRMAILSHLAPRDHFRTFLKDDYASELGKIVDMTESYNAFADDTYRFELVGTYENIGGISEPGNLDQYEAGCAKLGVANGPVPRRALSPSFQAIYEAQLARAIPERFTMCLQASRMDQFTEREYRILNAHHLIAPGGTPTLEEKNKTMADTLGMSLNEFLAQRAELQERRSAHSDPDEIDPVQRKCYALTQHDVVPGRSEDRGRTEEQRAAWPEDINRFDMTKPVPVINEMDLIQSDLADLQSDEFQTNADAMLADALQEREEILSSTEAAAPAEGADLIAEGCAGRGLSDSQCSCVRSTLENSTGGLSDGAKRMVTAIAIGDGLPEKTMMSIMMNTSRPDQQAAQQAMASAMPQIMMGCGL